jgi:lipopolysaccharide export system protein LptA
MISSRALVIGLCGLGWALLAGSAAAQIGASGHDNSAPIEITAEQLTVRQNENLAIFSGDVDAIQGEISLKADELRVFYVEGEDQAAAAGGGGQNIRRIEADGNVLLTAPEQSAAGQSGVYDVGTGSVVLIGNVILTRDANVIRGGRAEMDLNTGIATVLPGAQGERGPGQRVRALFQAQPSQEQ